MCIGRKTLGSGFSLSVGGWASPLLLGPEQEVSSLVELTIFFSSTISFSSHSCYSSPFLLGILEVEICISVLPACGTSALVIKIFTVLIVILCPSVAPFIRGSQKACLDIHTKLQETQKEGNGERGGVGCAQKLAPCPEQGTLGHWFLPTDDSLLSKGIHGTSPPDCV